MSELTSLSHWLQNPERAKVGGRRGNTCGGEKTKVIGRVLSVKQPFVQ